MPVSDPLLSVVIPVYNAASTVGRTIASLGRIDAGARPRVQVVLVNDGSTDSSLAEIEAARPPLPGFAWDVVDKPNGGAGSARNAGLAAARGEWVLFLDADDELAFDPTPVLAGAGARTCFGFTVEYRRGGRTFFRARPPRVTPQNWADVLTAKNPFQPSSLLFRRSCVERPFDEEIACVEDWLFWMANLGIFASMEAVPGTVSAVIHVHDQNISTQFARAGRNRIRVAEAVERMHAGRLTRKQRNNLRIQRQIGRLQQRLRIPAGTFWRFPCDPLLYAKLWAYGLANLVGLKASPYQRLFRRRKRAAAAED